MTSFKNALTKIPGVDSIAGILGIKSDAEEDLIKSYKEMQQQYDAYRPTSQAAHMAGLENILSPGMLGPINNQLAHMYGQGAQFDTSQLLRDPLQVGQDKGAQVMQGREREETLANLDKKQQGMAALQQFATTNANRSLPFGAAPAPQGARPLKNGYGF